MCARRHVDACQCRRPDRRLRRSHRAPAGRRLPAHGHPARRPHALAGAGRDGPRDRRRHAPGPQRRHPPVRAVLHAAPRWHHEPPDLVAGGRAHDPARAVVLAARVRPRHRRHAARVPRRDARARCHLPHPHRARRDVDGDARRDDARRARPAPGAGSEPVAVRVVDRLRPPRDLPVRPLPPAVRVRLPRPRPVHGAGPRGSPPARRPRRHPALLGRAGVGGRPGSRRRHRAVRRTGRRGPGRQPDADHVRPRPLDRRHQGGRLVGLDDLPRPGLAPDRAVDDDGDDHTGTARRRGRDEHVLRQRRRGALAHRRHRPQQQPVGRSPVGGLPPDVPLRAVGDVEPSAARALSGRGRRAASARRPRSSPRRRR